jgi:hypothetical protein
MGFKRAEYIGVGEEEGKRVYPLPCLENGSHPII